MIWPTNKSKPTQNRPQINAKTSRLLQTEQINRRQRLQSKTAMARLFHFLERRSTPRATAEICEPPLIGPTNQSPREWCAEALATFVADSSPNPFNSRAANLEATAYLDLTFQVEDELRAKIQTAPPDFVEAALSLLVEKPPAEWPLWSAFNGEDDWDYALDVMLGEFARLHPDLFFERAAPLIRFPAKRAKIIAALCGAVSLQAAETPCTNWLRELISSPAQLCPKEIWTLEDLLLDVEKVAFRARLSELQQTGLRELKRKWGAE